MQDDEDGVQLRYAADIVVLGAVVYQGDHRLGGLVLVAVLVTADVGDLSCCSLSCRGLSCRGQLRNIRPQG